VVSCLRLWSFWCRANLNRTKSASSKYLHSWKWNNFDQNYLDLKYCNTPWKILYKFSAGKVKEFAWFY
jgi:hypothetical protein